MKNEEILLVGVCPLWCRKIQEMMSNTHYSFRAVECLTESVICRVQKKFLGMVLCEGSFNNDIVNVCELLRNQDDGLVLIVLLEKNDAQLECRLLKLGVDDVVQPPIDLSIVVARFILRVEKQMSMSCGRDIVELNGVRIDFNTFYVINRGDCHLLSNTQAKLLRYMLARPNRVIYRDEIYNHVWNDVLVDTEGKCLEVHISKIRRMIEVNSKDPKTIITVHGRGYQINVPVLKLENEVMSVQNVECEVDVKKMSRREMTQFV